MLSICMIVADFVVFATQVDKIKPWTFFSHFLQKGPKYKYKV